MFKASSKTKDRLFKRPIKPLVRLKFLGDKVIATLIRFKSHTGRPAIVFFLQRYGQMG